MADERQEEPEDLDQPPPFFPYPDDETIRSDFEPGEPVRCEVEAVFAAQTDKLIQRYVLLTDGERKFPIMIGAFEASAITYALENHRPDRPLTHDLLRNLLENLGGQIVRIVIDDLWHETYYAKIFVRTDGKEFVLDSRPSDAIALAVRTESPIYVVEGILNQNDR
jgi:bifunctional DNase/RNase